MLELHHKNRNKTVILSAAQQTDSCDFLKQSFWATTSAKRSARYVPNLCSHRQALIPYANPNGALEWNVNNANRHPVVRILKDHVPSAREHQFFLALDLDNFHAS